MIERIIGNQGRLGRAACLAALAAIAIAAAGCSRHAGAPAHMTPGSPSAYAYITNYGQGTISQFQREPDGSLVFIGTTHAGAPHGPMGIAIHPSNRTLYAVNEGESRVYQFRLDMTTGNLAPLRDGFVNQDKLSAPQQIALDSKGAFAYVSNAGDGTISEYSIDPGDGSLWLIGTLRWDQLKSPRGIILSPDNHYAFAVDPTMGRVVAMRVDPSGLLTPVGSAPSLGDKPGQPGMAAVDPSGRFIYVTDRRSSSVARFTFKDGKLAYSGRAARGMPTSDANGIMVLPVGPEHLFAYVTEPAIDSVEDYEVNQGQFVPSGQTSVGFSGPAGMAADKSGTLLYVVGRKSGTVAQFKVVANRGGFMMLVGTAFTQDPPDDSSQPLFIALTH